MKTFSYFYNMSRRSQYDIMMERLEAEGKVTNIDPKESARIKEAMRKALEDYREKQAIREFKAAQKLGITILNA